MKKIFKLILPVFVMMIIAAVVIHRPQSTGALNANHNCDNCHSVHSAPGQSLTNNAVVEDLCLSCHGAAGISSLKAEIHTNKTGSSHPAFSMSCMDCHDPHDSMDNWLVGTNLKMVGSDQDGSDIARITTPNSGIREVVFESRGTDAGGPSLHSFADNDEDGNGVYDGVCETCHTLALNHRNNSSGNHSHYPGTNCIGCHPHDNNFHGAGGCCICHANIQGSRRAVVGEFSLTSHHVAAGAVTDDDCGVCHYEAQGAHADGNVDLLNPDSGARLTAFVSFTRNTSSDTLESWVIDVQDNLCMKCHDADGAAATEISGNPLRPFSSGSVDVPDVFAQFDPSNSFHHAIRQPGNNPYCIPSASNGSNITMETPWNQDATHDKISCFDCHSTSGHGDSSQRMLRSSIDFDSIEAGSYSTAIGAAIETFCTNCHKASVYLTGSDPEAVGSIFEFHGGGQSQHRASGGNEFGCMGCHAGIINEGGVSDNGGKRGNIHGGNFTWPADTKSPGATSIKFMLGGWLNGWDYNVSTGYCWGGNCAHGKNSKTYTR